MWSIEALLNLICWLELIILNVEGAILTTDIINNAIDGKNWSNDFSLKIKEESTASIPSINKNSIISLGKIVRIELILLAFPYSLF